MVWSTVAVFALALCLPYSGPVAAMFGFVPLPAALLAVSLLIVATYIGLTEWAKLRFFAMALKRRARAPARRR
jgi:Mg2+-importing ATPase